MATKPYVALLRGINVGGRNKVAMRDLRAVFEGAGYESVATYIQSGNVLFSTDAKPDGMEADLETMLESHLGVPLVVVVRAHDQLRRLVERAPEGFGAAPDTYYSDVVFLKAPLTGEDAMRIVELREGVDAAWPGDGVLYFQRLGARRTQSRMSKIVGKPEYQQMTIRSWATTTKLLHLLDRREEHVDN